MYEHLDGTKFWFKENSFILHREYGPAIERSNGDKAWYLNGELHRIDGPAIEYSNGDKRYYLNNEIINSEGEFLRKIRLKAFW